MSAHESPKRDRHLHLVTECEAVVDPDHPAPRGCEQCESEINWSDQLGAWVCRRCYLEAVTR